MAALRAAAARPSCASLAVLPPHLRASVYRRSLSTEIKQAYFANATTPLDWALEVPWSLLDHIHGTLGCSWTYALPLAALIVRCGIVFPFVLLPQRKAQQRLLHTQPIRTAWANAMLRQVSALPPMKGQSMSAKKKVFREELKKVNTTLSHRWKCQTWRMIIPAAVMPIFLLLAESIRRKVGSRPGLLGMIFGDRAKTEAAGAAAATTVGVEGAAESIEGATTAAAAAAASPDAVSEAMKEAVAQQSSWWAERFNNIIKEGGSPPNAPPIDPEIKEAARKQYLDSWLDPSMATEGPSWCVDLTAADPTFTLPIAVSALTLLQVLISSHVRPGQRVGKYAGVLRRVLLVVSLFLAPLVANMPSGILLYWASSTSLAAVTNLVMDRRWPLPAGVQATKRPLPPLENAATPLYFKYYSWMNQR